MRRCLHPPSCARSRPQFADQRVYRQLRQADGNWGAPEPLTAEGTQQRFADYVLDAGRNRCVGHRPLACSMLARTGGCCWRGRVQMLLDTTSGRAQRMARP